MIRDAVARYATRFHSLLGGAHGVASPFGAWLLLALIAPSAVGGIRDELAETLGCDVDEAFAAATALLRDPHPEIALGSAVWHAAEVETEPLLALIRRLAPPADSGAIPSQAEADAWALERTLGLIGAFPLDLDPSVILLLATAIATKVSWEVPFRVVPASAAVLPVGAGFAVPSLLREPGAAVWQGLLGTSAGLVAAVTARSANGLLVTSAVGGEAADPAAVLDACVRLATAIAAGDPPTPMSLFDLPLDDGPAWRLTESRAETGTRERYEILLPAWYAESDHVLLALPDSGFAPAAAALAALLPDGRHQAAAKQRAMARYTREGFEAAAVTGMMVRTSLVVAEEHPVRTARIEFTRPHAVVAATEGAGDWDGLPVFSAWVTEAIAAD